MLNTRNMTLKDCEIALAECDKIIAEASTANPLKLMEARMNRKDLLWAIYNLTPKH